MFKHLFCLLTFLYVINSNAQEQKPVRWNFKVGYEAGLQYFNLYILNANISSSLQYLMPAGTQYIKYYYKPTVMHSFNIGSTIFKNKTYYFNLGVSFSKNETTSYGFTTDQFGNPLRRTTSGWFKTASVSYGITKEIKIGKFDFLIPGIRFIQYLKFDGQITSKETVYDKFDGSIIKDGDVDFTYPGILGVFSARPLMIFDNPRISIEYQRQFFKGLRVGISYAYQFSDGIDYLYKNAFTWDLSGHNISIVIGYKLFNN